MILSMVKQGFCQLQKVRDVGVYAQKGLLIVGIMMSMSSLSAQPFLGRFLTIEKRLESVAASCNTLHHQMSDQVIVARLGCDAECVNVVLNDIHHAMQKPVVFLKALHVLVMHSTQDPLINTMKKTIEKYCYLSFLQYIGARDELYRLNNGLLHHMHKMYKYVYCEHESRFRPFTTTIAYAYIVMRIIEAAHLQSKDCFYAVFKYGEMLKKQLDCINACLHEQGLDPVVIERFVWQFQEFVEKECFRDSDNASSGIKKGLFAVAVAASVCGAYYMLKKGTYEVTAAASSGLTQGVLTTLGRPENQHILQQTTTGVCSAATDQALNFVADERLHASLEAIGQRVIAGSIDTLEREQERLNTVIHAGVQAGCEPVLPGLAFGVVKSCGNIFKKMLIFCHGAE